jgi:uncharacterized protein with HEPN domain
MRKDPKVYLNHILHSIHAIEKYLQGVSKEAFLESEEKQDLGVEMLHKII